MRTWACWGFWLGLGLSSSALLAQTEARPQRPSEPGPATQPAQESYWLRVTAKQLNVRSRPDTNSVIIARLEPNSVLQAVGSEFGWHRVLPPQGAFSYVSAAYIERRGPDEGVVAVRSGKLRVRVGSLLGELDPENSDVQVRLERGTPVRIVGAQGEWLKIVPPKGVYGYVSDEHVTRVNDEVASRLRAAWGVTSQPAVGGGATPATQPVAAATTQPAPGPNLSGPWGQRLVLVETAINVEAEKPLLEQAWGESIARLRPIAAQREEPTVARLAQAWTEQLEAHVADQDAVRAAEDVLRRTERERAQYARELARIERLRQRATSRPTPGAP